MPKQFEPLKDSDEMPSGKYKGHKMIDVPAGYLLYIYEEFPDTIRGEVKAYIQANLDVIKQQAKKRNND